MSNPPPPLTDRDALARYRSRIRQDAMFLHSEAIDEIKDRLSMVNRAFKSPAIVTGHPAIWADVIDDANIVHDDELLDLDPAAHDLVIHAMSLHWANDPVGQLIQCRRALRPDGLMLAILPAGKTLIELRASLAEAESRLLGGLSPRILPMGDVRDLGALLQRAGFALPVADSVHIAAEYGDLKNLMHDLRFMGEANALAARSRTFAPRTLFWEAEQIYRAAYPGNLKALRATFELVTMTGWAPHNTQQQPLRPGSAQARLADALKTDETSLPD